ncbi:unnamed protein product [Hermetia illucens]|uniref:carboxylesterase n=2 Tax=Hermetia illucens TaxID=343691 RepID=A0A7R8UD15_HERIL|nr:esterase B1 isoform X2 [Hermetia illucens]CAD7078429.1 unnamed protein product [Hermetia illucens]
MSSVRNISVKVKQGTLIGQESNLPSGNPYYSFKGVPYAVPPIGELRFQSPKPLEKFPESILDCSKEGNKSFHRDPFSSDIVGSEDCLFLNVYTPKLKSDRPLPVMVWVHGGAFLMGSGDSDFYLPVYLLEEDVVVVTLNYRLGMFGFLYAPDADVPGNAGLKDQLLALKWVKENINQFNGDPNNVTLFGQSAGSASIHLHLLSQNSKKYFHKVICQSGTSNMEWVMQNIPRYKTRRLAQLMGFESESEADIVKFLRETNETIDIFKHLIATLTPDERRRGLPMPFKPVVEAESSDAIVTKPPLEAAKEPNAIDIPVMMGYTSEEGITMLVNACRKLDELDQDLARMIPRSVDLDPNDPLCLVVADEMRKFYFNGEKVTMKKVKELCNLMTDYHFGIGIHAAAEIHARYQHKSPLYFYRFSYSGKLNLFKKWFNFTQLKGACHGDELFYLFKTGFEDAIPEEESADFKMIKNMCRMWANFAKYGNPTPDSDSKLPCKWTPVKPTTNGEQFVLDYLEIDHTIKMDKNPDDERIQFWREVYRKYNKHFLQPKL